MPKTLALRVLALASGRVLAPVSGRVPTFASGQVLALVLGLAVLAPACFISRTSVNEPLRRAEIDRLVPGQTTAKEVVAILGAPNEVVQLGSRTAYRYDFSIQKRAGFTLILLSFLNEDTRADRVWLFFGADDVLTHAGATLEAVDARYAMPWQNIHGR